MATQGIGAWVVTRQRGHADSLHTCIFCWISKIRLEEFGVGRMDLCVCCVNGPMALRRMNDLLRRGLLIGLSIVLFMSFKVFRPYCTFRCDGATFSWMTGQRFGANQGSFDIKLKWFYVSVRLDFNPIRLNLGKKKKKKSVLVLQC